MSQQLNYYRVGEVHYTKHTLNVIEFRHKIVEQYVLESAMALSNITIIQKCVTISSKLLHCNRNRGTTSDLLNGNQSL